MLKIKNVTKVFNLTGNKEDTRVALDNVSLTIKDGDFVTIIGGNGSGKSTLMNIITGVLTPENGKVLLNDKDITNITEYKRAPYFGRVFQDPMLGTAGDMSVIENLEIAYRRGKRNGLRWGFKKSHVELFKEELKKFDLGLETRLYQKVKLLSGGQRQALTLLMAVMANPQILLLDEHTAALDPKTAKNVLTITDKIIQENNLTTLMITHNLKDAIKYGNRLVMLHNGKIILDVRDEEKSHLKVEDLLTKFQKDDAIDDNLFLN